MATTKTISLEHIRTDGWFERLGETITSFDTLCDVLGKRFFAFALITGARVSSLMIDRFNPDQSLVEFSFAPDDDPNDDDIEQLTIAEFRQRLVAGLMSPEPKGPNASELKNDDPEPLQQHIGPRTLLLASLYGYQVNELIVKGNSSQIRIDCEGTEENLNVPNFRERLLEHVREDFERGVPRRHNAAIDLHKVDEAEKAAEQGAWTKVLQLLGNWPMPLSIYWRTPEGQMLSPEARQRIAEGLGLLGTACAELGDGPQGEEVLRLAVQYAQDGSAAPKIFTRLGCMFLSSERPGEAIGMLRRAYTLHGDPEQILPFIIRAFLDRQQFLPALAFLLEAKAKIPGSRQLAKAEKEIRKYLGTHLTRWETLVAN